MGFEFVSAANSAKLLGGIEQIESLTEYPIGSDSFKIDHGKDYFAFFKRLGHLRYAVWKQEGRIAAVAAAVLRNVPFKNGTRRSWYLCDLKVHPEFRKQKIPLKIVVRAFVSSYLKCGRAYAISMNPNDGKPNRVLRLLRRFRWLNFQHADTLLIWSFSSDEMERALSLVVEHRGPVSFLSLAGVKDLILSSTKEPMPLLHAQFGHFAEITGQTIRSDASHMFCTPINDSLTWALAEAGYNPQTSATIIGHRMEGTDWSWVLTSEI